MRLTAHDPRHFDRRTTLRSLARAGTNGSRQVAPADETGERIDVLGGTRLAVVAPVVSGMLAEIRGMRACCSEIHHEADLGVAWDLAPAPARALPWEAVSRDGAEAGGGVFGRRWSLWRLV